MPKTADSVCGKVYEKLKLRRPALRAIILHCGTQLARIAPPNTVTDSYTRFLQEAQPISIQSLGHPHPNHMFLHYRNITCLNTLVGSVRYLITLLKYNLFYYIAQVNPRFLHSWAKLNPKTLLRYTHSYHLAKQFPKNNTMLSYTQS